MPSLEHSSSHGSLEIIKPFVDLVGNDADVQIMGGVGTSALEHPDVEINVERREVYAPKGFFQSAYRDNGSLRDVDVFVASSDPERLTEVDEQLAATVGSQLDRRVFGIHGHDILASQIAHPFGRRILRMFASDRYEVSPDVSGIYVKSLFPFAVPIEPETLEPWTLVTDGGEVPIPHPGVTITNYTSRSISGLRHKDKPKITEATSNILTKAPQIREWLYDGPGQTQLELSTIIASLRRPGKNNVSLVNDISVNTYTNRELIEHERFMLPDMNTTQKMAIISIMSIKANGLGWAEASEPFIDFWQRHNLERRAEGIVTNA